MPALTVFFLGAGAADDEDDASAAGGGAGVVSAVLAAGFSAVDGAGVGSVTVEEEGAGALSALATGGAVAAASSEAMVFWIAMTCWGLNDTLDCGLGVNGVGFKLDVVVRRQGDVAADREL